MNSARPSTGDRAPTARGETLRLAAAGALALGRERWIATLERHGPWRIAAAGLLLVLVASPWPPLTVAALAAYLIVTLKQPGLTVALLPFAAPFAYAPKDLFGPRLPAVELLLLIALLAGAVQLAVRGRRQVAAGGGAAAILDAWDALKAALRAPFGLQGAALLAIASLSLLTVADPGHLRESLREYRTVIVGPVIYFFLARYWLRNRELRRIAIAAFLAGAAVVALLGVGQVLAGRGVVAAEGVRRAVGPYRHPNALAFYLARALPFAAALLALAPTAPWGDERQLALSGAKGATSDERQVRAGGKGPRGAGEERTLSFSSRLALGARRSLRSAQGKLALVAPGPSWPLLAAGALLAVGLLLTFSRGAFVGVGVALLLLAALAERRAVRLGLLGALAVGGVLVLLLSGARLDSLTGGGGSVGLRRLIWDSTVRMIRDYPAFGVGLDQFLYQYAPRYIHPAAWEEKFTSHPHNLFLDFWVRLGIMGLAWIGWTLLAVGARVADGLRVATGATRRLLVAAGLACCAAVVHGLVDNFYFLIDLAFIWWFLLALIQVAADAAAREADALDGTAAAATGARRRTKRSRRAAGDDRRDEPPAAPARQPAPVAEPVEGW